MRLDSFFSGAMCVMSGGRLPEAFFMVFLLDSKGALLPRRGGRVRLRRFKRQEAPRGRRGDRRVNSALVRGRCLMEFLFSFSYEPNFFCLVFCSILSVSQFCLILRRYNSCICVESRHTVLLDSSVLLVFVAQRLQHVPVAVHSLTLQYLYLRSEDIVRWHTCVFGSLEM